MEDHANPLARKIGFNPFLAVVAGNSLGILVSISYFLFFSDLHDFRSVDAVLGVTVALFVIQAIVGSLRQRNFDQDIYDFILMTEAGDPVPPDILHRAQRKIINRPFVSAGISFLNWMVAATVMALVYFIFHPTLDGGALRLGLGIALSGVVTAGVIFFVMEGLCRRTWPLFFPQGGAAKVRGTAPIPLRLRLLAAFLLTGFVPLALMASLAYSKSRLMLTQDPVAAQASLTNLILFLMAVFVILWVIVARLFARSILLPVKDMESAMNKVARGDLTRRARTLANDELGRLSDLFNDMVEGLKERERMRAYAVEMEKGRRIQKDFLPHTLGSSPGVETAFRFHPAREVSGDFYDVFPLPGGRLGLVIADVCDKGVGSALFMALFRSLIRVFGQYVHQRETPESAGACPDPEHILQAVALTNDYIASEHGGLCMFATLFFGVLDIETGELSYVNGGHEPLILLKPGGEREFLPKTGPAVGFMEGVKFGIGRVRIPEGGILLGLTDGVTEAEALNVEAYGRERLYRLLDNPPETAEALLDRIEEDLFRHTGGARQSDDITLLALRKIP